ncbi:MAG: DUF4340 domain-containing protein [Proteocatella sp.]
MIKQIKMIRIMSVTTIVLILMNAIVYYYSPKKEQEKILNQSYMITDINVGDFKGLSIKNDKISFGIIQNGEKIEVISENEFKYNIGEMRTLIYAACHMSSEIKINDAVDLNKYGYSSPKAEITIFTNDNKYILKLLDINPIDGKYYIYSEGQKTLYLIDKEIAEIYLKIKQ